MFHRLVSWAILAQTNAVVGIDPNAGIGREGGKAQGGTHVIRKDQEGGAERNYSGGQVHAVHNAAHGVLTHTEMDAAPLRRTSLKIRSGIDKSFCGWMQIG